MDIYAYANRRGVQPTRRDLARSPHSAIVGAAFGRLRRYSRGCRAVVTGVDRPVRALALAALWRQAPWLHRHGEPKCRRPEIPHRARGAVQERPLLEAGVNAQAGHEEPTQLLQQDTREGETKSKDDTKVQICTNFPSCTAPPSYGLSCHKSNYNTKKIWSNRDRTDKPNQCRDKREDQERKFWSSTPIPANSVHFINPVEHNTQSFNEIQYSRQNKEV